MNKKIKTLIMGVIFILLTLLLCQNPVYADNSQDNSDNSATAWLDKALESTTNPWDISVGGDLQKFLITLISRILGIIQIFGIIVSVIMFAMIGFRLLLGILPGELGRTNRPIPMMPRPPGGEHREHDMKALNDSMIFYLIGCILLTGGVSIIKFLIDVITSW